jgi:hypothetical protein
VIVPFHLHTIFSLLYTNDDMSSGDHIFSSVALLLVFLVQMNSTINKILEKELSSNLHYCKNYFYIYFPPSTFSFVFDTANNSQLTAQAWHHNNNFIYEPTDSETRNHTADSIAFYMWNILHTYTQLMWARERGGEGGSEMKRNSLVNLSVKFRFETD